MGGTPKIAAEQKTEQVFHSGGRKVLRQSLVITRVFPTTFRPPVHFPFFRQGWGVRAAGFRPEGEGLGQQDFGPRGVRAAGPRTESGLQKPWSKPELNRSYQTDPILVNEES